MKSVLFVLAIVFSILKTNAQVGIGTTLPYAALDVTSTNDGLLIPRVALTATATVLPVLTGTTSELVYNTNTAGDVTPGFYYLSTATGPWVRLGTAASTAWEILGNTNIVDGTNFIGTGAATDVDVAFRRNNVAAGKIGLTNTSIGLDALTGNASYNNTSIGVGALKNNTNNASANNVAMGFGALDNLSNNVCSQNIAIGTSALGNAGGSFGVVNNNVAIGYNSQQGLQTGIDNTSVGTFALSNNLTGNQCTALGRDALLSSTGSANVGIGFDAGRGNTGANNTFLGWQAGRNGTTGSNNTFLGYQAGLSTTGSNNIAIGNGAQVGVAANSNQIRIGDATISLATTQIAWTTTSDKRLKSNIENSALGLDFIKTLRPVSYTRKNDDTKKTEYGFIAQEIENALNKAGDKNNGIISKDDNGFYGVRYNDFTPITIKAVQEQQELIEELQKTNAELMKTNAAILKRLEKLEKNKSGH